MSSSSLRPSRSFNDDDGVQMHMRSGKHTVYTCTKCGKCEYCDHGFTTNEDRLAHQTAEHQPKFECRYCDHEFTAVQGRGAHEEAKHSMFECHCCDHEFNSEEARQQREDANHPTFGCRSCVRKFFSEDAREQHENATHLTFECRYCDRQFSSESARQQHENAKHHFECKLCGKSFTQVEEFQRHIECSYCTIEFFTPASKIAHEKSCNCNPANRVMCSTLAPSNRPPLRFGSLSSNAPKLTGSIDEESSTRPPAEPFSDTSTQSSPTSPSHSIVFVSVDEIPEYIRENRAILVATSTGSPSSDHTSLRLSSSSSLESLVVVEPLPTHRERSAAAS